MEKMRDLSELSNNMRGKKNHSDENIIIDESNVEEHLYPVTLDSPLSELEDSEIDEIDEKVKLVDPMSVENLSKQYSQSGGKISVISTSRLIYNRNKMMYMDLQSK